MALPCLGLEADGTIRKHVNLAEGAGTQRSLPADNKVGTLQTLAMSAMLGQRNELWSSRQNPWPETVHKPGDFHRLSPAEQRLFKNGSMHDIKELLFLRYDIDGKSLPNVHVNTTKKLVEGEEQSSCEENINLFFKFIKEQGCVKAERDLAHITTGSKYNDPKSLERCLNGSYTYEHQPAPASGALEPAATALLRYYRYKDTIRNHRDLLHHRKSNGK